MTNLVIKIDCILMHTRSHAHKVTIKSACDGMCSSTFICVCIVISYMYISYPPTNTPSLLTHAELLTVADDIIEHHTVVMPYSRQSLHVLVTYSELQNECTSNCRYTCTCTV